MKFSQHLVPRMRVLLLIVSVVGSVPAVAADDPMAADRASHSESVVTIMGDTDARPVSDIAAMVTDADNSANNSENIAASPLRVLPMIGAGGMRNLSDLLFLRGVDLAIVPGSALDDLKARDPQLSALAAGRLRAIARLYNAELHVVVRRDRIHELRQLAGKVVNLLETDGSTDLVGTALFTKLKIRIKPVHFDLTTGLSKVASGEIAATLVFAGAPVEQLSRIAATRGLALLPVDDVDGTMVDGAGAGRYLPSLLHRKDYPGLFTAGSASVATIAAPLMLAVYDYPDEPLRTAKIARFVDQLFKAVGRGGVTNRHPKWRDVNFAATLAGWQQDAAVTAWLRNAKPFVNEGGGSSELTQSTPKPGSDLINGLLKGLSFGQTN